MTEKDNKMFGTLVGYGLPIAITLMAFLLWDLNKKKNAAETKLAECES
jgi:hypothetical protein